MTNVFDRRGTKNAIDFIFKFFEPQYLMILGSPDVVQLQDLKNPAYTPNQLDGDRDEYCFSDLPYACDVSYSQDTANFVGPTRVVGRLPDLTGASRAILSNIFT